MIDTYWQCADCNAINHEIASECQFCTPSLASRAEMCPDCGAWSEIQGHQTCQYPSGT